ncbi:MAG: winged helix-turn-helix transcriptional regulator [Desulfovibrionaceae bacterium]
MISMQSDFFKPNKDARVLSILESVANNPSASQQRLGRGSGLSSAMVNHYLKTLQETGLIRFEPVNGKSFKYLLTSEGEQRRRCLFDTYSSEIVRVYTALKNAIMDRLAHLTQRGVNRLVLFGASETCEVTLSALMDTGLTVVAILDNDPNKHGKGFHGYIISSPAILESLDCQAIVVTSFGRRDEIIQQLNPFAKRRGVEVVGL